MDCEPYDSSGTDDDIPLPHQNRIQRGGHIAGSVPYGRVYNDGEMETQIHLLEQEAYSSVLRAFKAQADVLTWEKESLMTELRKELRLSNEEHREILSRVKSDDLIRRIREWRVCRDPIIPVSVSRKKQKIVSSQRGTKIKKPKSTGQLLPGRAPQLDHLIGRKVKTRWPDDNNFYEAVITNYNAHEGRHALVYDIGTENETWEWVNLSEISPEDILWKGDNQLRTDRPVVGRSRNGAGKKGADEIQILNTKTLIKEVERVFSNGHLDPIEIERAKKALKEQEQALTAAIGKLADISNGENGMKLH